MAVYAGPGYPEANDNSLIAQNDWYRRSAVFAMLWHSIVISGSTNIDRYLQRKMQDVMQRQHDKRSRRHNGSSSK